MHTHAGGGDIGHSGGKALEHSTQDMRIALAITPAPCLHSMNALSREKNLSCVIMVVRMENVNNRKSLNRIFDNTEIL